MKNHLFLTVSKDKEYHCNRGYFYAKNVIAQFIKLKFNTDKKHIVKLPFLT